MADIKGTNGNDTIVGTESADKLEGDDGNDVLYGEGGSDELLGGKGDDTIFGGAGDERTASGKVGIKGGSGNDVIYAQEGNDGVDGGKGADLIYGGAGNDELLGDYGNDTLSGGAGNDTLDGGKDDDFLCGGDGDDSLSGGTGLDTLYAGPGNDVLEGGKGADAFYVGLGGGNNTVFGETGGGSIKDNDVLYVEGTVEVQLNGTTYTLNAGDSLNILGMGLDKDDDDGIVTLADGTTVSFDEIARIEAVADIEDPAICDDPTDGPDGVVDGEETGEVMGLGYDDALGATDGGGDLITNGADSIEGNGGDDTIDAAGGDDTIDGGEGDDDITGGGGNDTVISSTGTDTIDGGTGTDTYTVPEGAPADPNIGAPGDEPARTGNIHDITLADNDDDDEVEVQNDSGIVKKIDLNDDNAGGAGEDVRITDDGTGDFEGRDKPAYFKFPGGGGGDDTNDVARFDLSTFDDDFAITVKSEDLDSADGDNNPFDVDGPIQDVIVLEDVDNITDNGDGTVTVEYTGRDGQTHFMDIEYGGARIEAYGPGGGSLTETIEVEVDNNGDGTVDKINEGTTDTVTSVENFVAGESPDEADEITLTDPIGDNAVATEITGLTDDSVGTITTSGGVIAFGPGEDYQLSNILNGTSPGGGLPPVGPVGDYTITAGDEDGQVGDISFSNFETINFSVVTSNDDPVAVDDTNSGDEDTVIAGNVLGNDSDADGDTLEVTGNTDPSNGSVVVNPDGSYEYTPDADFNGTDSFTYTVSDGNGGTDTATVSITVNPVNDDPVAVDDTGTGDEDGLIVGNVLSNDSDVDGDTLEVIGNTDPANGTLVINPDGSYGYTPDPDFNGTDTFTYTVSDGNGGTDTATVTLTVNPVNDDPVAVDDTPSTDEDTPVIVPVLANDTDVDGDTLEIDSFTQPPNGTVTDNGDGTVTYEPDPGFNGTDTFTYTVSDGNGGTDTGTVTVTVGAVNDDPTANDDAVPTDEDTPVIFDPTANDTDPDGDPLEVSAIGDPANGTITDNGDGTFTYTPDPDFNGTDTVTYTVSDGNGGTDTGTVTFNVAPVNDDPVAVDDSESTSQGTPVIVPVLANDTDVDGDTLSIDSFTQPPNGTVTDNGDGTVTYTPDPAFAGTDTFTYTVSDGNGGTDTGTVSVTVSDVIGPVDGLDSGENMGPGYTDLQGDQIDGTDGDNDTIFGNGGDDTIDSGVGDDTVDGGGGDDTFILAEEGNGIDNDVIIGGETDETIGDTVDTSDITDDMTVVFTAPEEGTITDGTDTTEFEEIERIITGEGNDTVTGSDGDEYVETQGGDDSMSGGGGNDTLISGDGLDTIDGGDGDDSLVGGDEADSITGGEGDDTIIGGRGPDTLDGGAGDDSILGGNDDDTIIGGDGNDTVDGGNGDNFIDTSGGTPLVDDKNGDGFGFAPYGPFPAAPADTDENDDRDFVVAGSGNDTIITGDDADTIFGGSGNNVIDGGIDDDVITTTFGDDLIIGGEGSDTISAGAGNDTIYGGLDPAFPDALNIPDDGSGPFGPDPDPENGRDFIEGGAGNDLIYGQDDDDTIFGGGGADTIYGGIDDDFIDGGNIKDDLYGGQGNDTILGGGGSDNIEGGEGADSMEGGDDNDRFIINAREDAFGDTVIGGNGPDENTDNDILDLRGLGKLAVVGEVADATDAGATTGTVNFLAADGVTVEGTLQFSQIERLIICFTPGVAIATPKGEIAVEDLKAGDRVITRDDGVQEIRWIGSKKVSALGMQADPSLRPVMIRKGALGNGLPERDMMVSPNHRMLMANEHTHVLFDEREVLIAAKHLVGQPGIERAQVPHTEYIHVMFDRHEVILGDGAWTESFHPGDYSLKGIDKEQRDEIFKLFPELMEAKGLQNYGAARHSLKGYEAKMLREGLVL